MNLTITAIKEQTLFTAPNKSEAIQNLAERLSSYPNLESVILWNNGFENGDAVPIIQTLLSNRTITYFNIRNNTIGDLEGEVIAQVLAVNTTLREILFDADKMTREIKARIIESARNHNCSLTLMGMFIRPSSDHLEGEAEMLMLNRSLSMRLDTPKDWLVMDMNCSNSPASSSRSYSPMQNDEGSFEDFDPCVEADILESQFESLAKEVAEERYEGEIFWGNFS